jgi:hypothetical protein
MSDFILPKCWLQRIDKYWDRTVPTDYPESESSFSLTFESQDIKEAVKIMESNLTTDDSIVSAVTLAEHTILGSYVGTYNVTIPEVVKSEDAEEEVALSSESEISAASLEDTVEEATEVESTEAAISYLISPEKLPNGAIAAVAFFYDKETEAWIQVENVTVQDNYIYGEVKASGPVAVFSVKRDTYVDTSKDVTIYANVFVANGIPITVYKDGSDIIVKDANGKETKINTTYAIIGGTVDGSDVESTSVYVGKGVKLQSVYGGSYQKATADPCTVGTVNVVIEGATIKGVVAGACVSTRADNVNITVKDSTVNGALGAGISWSDVDKKDANTLEGIGFTSKTWVKNFNYTVENSTIGIMYAGGTSGYLYVDNSEGTVKGSYIQYNVTGGSNGKSNNVVEDIEDSSIEYFQTTNRGFVTSVKATVKNCQVKMFFVAGDSTDSKVTGTVDSVKLDITGGIMNLYPGTNGGIVLTSEVAKSIVKSLKISRSTTVYYLEDSANILGDLIRIK